MSDELTDWHDPSERPPQPGEYECAIPFREGPHRPAGAGMAEPWGITDASFAWYGTPTGPIRWRGPAKP